MKSTAQFSLVLIGVGVSLVAFLTVIQGWHAFRTNTKFEAVLFLFMLILYPAVVARTRNQSGLVQFSGPLVAYILILMALIVFTTQ